MDVNESLTKYALWCCRAHVASKYTVLHSMWLFPVHGMFDIILRTDQKTITICNIEETRTHSVPFSITSHSITVSHKKQEHNQRTSRSKHTACCSAIVHAYIHTFTLTRTYIVCLFFCLFFLLRYVMFLFLFLF